MSTTPGMIAFDLPVEGPLTARDARLGVKDCRLAKEAAEKSLASTFAFWDKKIASLQARCPHETTAGSEWIEQPDGDFSAIEWRCEDCGKEQSEPFH